MTVYVDAAIHGFGRMVMCHMFSPDVEELHRMADRIGVARKWFQDPRTMPKVSWPHYDIAKSKRALAVSFGAVECDKYQTVAMGAIIKNIYWDTDVFKPMRWFTGFLASEYERIGKWLGEQGFPQQEYDL